LTLGKAVFDGHVLAFNVAGFLEALLERGDLLAQRSARSSAQESNHGHHRLLRARRARPRCRAAEQCDEIAARHSITSSARDRNDSGIVRPSGLAVVRLMTRSNLVGCSTGMSPGFVPRRILST